MILSRDVPGQRSLSRDIYSCPCPGTKGHRDKENVLVPGQRDSGTSRPVESLLATHNPLILIGEILKANNRVLVWFQMMIVMVYVWMIYYFL